MSTADCLTAFESKVLEYLLGGDDPVLDLLRRQLAHCTVTSRESTGVGFFTNLSFSPAIPRLTTDRRLQIAGVYGDIPGLKHGAGFALFVEEGVMVMLEGYSFDEPWPTTIHGFTLRYARELPRDSSRIRTLWDDARRP